MNRLIVRSRCLAAVRRAAALVAVLASGLPAPAPAGVEPLPFPRIAAGDSLRSLGDVDRAEAEYRAALAIAKNHQVGTSPREDGVCLANYGLARIALHRRQPEVAEDLLDSCDDKPKFEGQYLLGKGLVDLAKNDLDDAETTLIQAANRVAQKGPSPSTNALRLEIVYTLVDIAEAKGTPGIAVNHLDEVIALLPNDPGPLIKKGRLLVITRQYNEALAAFTQAVKIDTTAVEAYKEVATLFMRATPRRPADAAAALGRVVKFEPTAANYLALGAAHEAARQPAPALAAYEQALALDPGSAAAQLGMARNAFKAGDRERALTAYQAIKDPSTLSAEDQENIGRIHLDRKEYAAAREAYLRAVALDSSLVDARYYVGYSYFVEKKYKEAIPYFEARIAADSTWAPAYANLGIALLQSGEGARGLAMIERAVRIDPEDTQSRILYGQALMSQSQWSRAVTEFRAVLEREPQHAEALRGLGYCLLNQERYNEAIDALAKANAAQPGHVDGMIWLAQSYGMTGQLDRADSIFRQVLAIDPGNADALAGRKAIEQANQKGRRSKS